MSYADARLIDQIPRYLLGAVLAAGLTGTLSGCSPDTGGRVPVAGTVTLGGTMLDRGTIEFHPLSTGTITGGTIRDGRFEIPATKGALPGKYEARVYSTDVDSAPIVPDDLPPGPESERRPLQPELIHKRYNLESELTAEIPEGGTSELVFELDS
ncbi:hypothetical protein FF011L_41390 [Roseimaritima multifibrata]|uniref:Carboxypeptidase regulatory-like domain-containing protein n=1 Tax=Roseimaritima multifibrata TaxID=1930274 RepID=A0A517MKD6_9BACT|nr:hypothetical protein [Roseimaritima multifibrata]QDS95345.1 hypothetical protein FF011L_41390 [Roseimaritima multifibrata]